MFLGKLSRYWCIKHPRMWLTSFSFIEAIWNVTHKHDVVFLTIMWNTTQAHTHYFPITFLHCFTDPTRESFKYTECVCVFACVSGGVVGNTKCMWEKKRELKSWAEDRQVVAGVSTYLCRPQMPLSYATYSLSYCISHSCFFIKLKLCKYCFQKMWGLTNC